jgi:hypothetical protein
MDKFLYTAALYLSRAELEYFHLQAKFGSVIHTFCRSIFEHANTVTDTENNYLILEKLRVCRQRLYEITPVLLHVISIC